MKKALLVFAVLLAGCHKSGPPYSPKDALRTFHIEKGYRIETFVTEPDVVSPVAMDFDENGRIFVVEDRGYPLNTEGKVGRIRLLEDTNGDGIPDRSTIFADHLTMPTGVMRWKKGILVTDAPDVLYLEDTNGDGKADVRQVVLTGFAFTNPQHTVNGPVYGLDNWIYLAREGPATAIIFKEKFGDRGSDLRFPARPDLKPLPDRNHDIRFRPDTWQLEALSGASQFGHTFDDWAHHFTTNNSDHARHEVIAARYLERNPDLPVPTAMQQIPDHGAAAKVFPITVHPRFEMLTNVGEFTSACGITYYHGSLFVAEPAHNLAHRDVLQDAGATFVARRAQEGVEFLASTDAWFRPVNFYVGPDGALYLIDYYRLVIEHPEWMSTNTHHSKALTEGIDRGRIYRIVPEGGLPLPKNIRLGSASDSELVAQLANPNIWWRRTAQRLLLDRKATGAAPELIKLAEQSPAAVGRLHALWTLEGLGKLEPALIAKALHDPEGGVRENAVVLAEMHHVALPAGDPDPKVQFQLLLSSSDRNERERLLDAHIDDKWFQLAALSYSSDEAARLLAKPQLARQACAVVGARQKSAEIQQSLEKHGSADCLDGLAAGMRGRRVTVASSATLLKLFDSPQPAVRGAALRLMNVMGLPPGSAGEVRRAAATAQDPKADPQARADAIGLLALAGPQPNEALFKKLVDPHQPEAVEEAAVRAVGKVKGDEVGGFLLKNWRNMTGAVRADAADAMFLDPGRVKMLLAALKSGDVQPWTLAFRHKRRLIMNPDAAIRDAARPLLEQAPGDREAVVKRYQAALDRKADLARGREVFRSVCAKCHRLEGVGAEVGPNLVTVRNQPKQVLLRDILIPSESIAQGYEAYVVETDNGTFDGVMGSQTSGTLVLKHEDGKEDVIQRKDIRNMYVTNLSAMPGDLEKQVDQQQMADLLEYLKTVAGN